MINYVNKMVYSFEINKANQVFDMLVTKQTKNHQKTRRPYDLTKKGNQRQ